jgi:hypothetical protein
MAGSSALASRVAAAHLGDAEREALELHDGAGAGYAEVADRLGIEPREVASVLADARLRVREAVRGAPLPPVESPDCARARPLLAARQDGEPVSGDERDFLRAHVAACAACRTTRVALREGTLALRAAFGAVPAPVVVPAPRAPVPVPRPPAAPARTRRRTPALVAAAVLALGAGASAAIILGGDSPRTSAAEPEPAAATVAPTATPARTAAPKKKKAAAAARKKKRAAKPKATATPRATTPAAVPVATSAPQATATPEKKAPRKRPTTPATDDAETETGTSGGGLPKPTGTPAPGATATPIPDSCSEDNPDCDSG